ncbi:MAG: PfkB family carbohydrate kinase [Ilumatobacteraceae bacterium]
MLGSVGDLVEDVVVHLHEKVHVASDTSATVIRRRGGSAANVVAAACRAGGAARFIGQVGDDATGRGLTDELAAAGADVVVRRAGRTATIIVLVDAAGERTMLSDRATCVDLSNPEPAWLDGLHTLHIPYYSLVGEPLATTTATLATWAARRGINVSIDTSSAAILQHVGPAAALDQIRSLRPSVVLANELEAATLGPALHPDHLGGALVVVKQGADPAIVLRHGQAPVSVAAEAVTGVRDTTGAGDAFAAGLLLSLAGGADVLDAVRRAHTVAADAVRRASAQTIL